MARHTYQLATRVEAGDISDLYRGAADRSREVLLKVFAPRASDPAYGKALVEAARRVGELGHPSILHFEEVGLHASQLCAVRSYVDGQHLGVALVRLATKEVVLPGPVALQIMVEVMAAVGAAHARGIVHGALTPANILVARDGRVFVSDFGALWAVQQSLSMQALAGRGRKAYRAPETAGGLLPDLASDVFSVGAILYELLTLRSVGDGHAGVSTRREPLLPPSRLDRRINARLDPLVLRALEPIASRRFKSCLEMEEAFRGYLVAQGAASGRAEIGRFVTELFPNEVSVEGSTTGLPFAGEFELEPVEAGVSIPGLAIEVGERVSYSAPVDAAADLGALLPQERASDKTTLDEPPLLAAADPITEGLQNRLEPWEDKTAPQASLPARAPPAEPEETNPQGPPSGEMQAEGRLSAPPERLKVRRPAMEAGNPTHTPVDPLGHLGEGTERSSFRMRRRRSSLALWVLSVAMSVGAASFTYLGLKARLGSSAPPRAHHSAAHPAAPPVPGALAEPAPRPKEKTEPMAALASAQTAVPHREPAARASSGASCLDLSADVRAQVMIDDGPGVDLPLDGFAVSPGAHKLVVVDSKGKYSARELAITDDATRCPGKPIKVAFRHHEPKD